MKNNKKILTEEILRIQKIMGVIKEDILSESPEDPKLWELITKIFKKDASKITSEDITKEVESASERIKVNPQIVENGFKSLLEKLKTGGLNDADKEFMSSVLRALDPIGIKTMSNEVINALKSARPHAADEIINYLKDPRYSNEDILPYLQKQFPNIDDASLTILRDELQENPIEFKTQPEPIPTPQPEPEPTPEPSPEPEPTPEPNPEDSKKFNESLKKLMEFFTIDNLIDVLKYKTKTNLWINESFTSGKEKGFSDKMAEINKNIVSISNEYSEALKDNTTIDYTEYRKRIFEQLAIFKRMSQQVKIECRDNLIKQLPSNVLAQLNTQKATESFNEKELTKLWNYITENNGNAKDFETKYTTFVQGFLKIFTEKDKRGQRILRLLLNWDARLGSEYRNNILSRKFGRASVLSIELFKRAAILAGFYGAIDYWLALQENKNGLPVTIPEIIPYIGGVQLEPLVKWDKDNNNTVLGGTMYLASHMLRAAWERFKTQPIESISNTGPLISLYETFITNPELQRKRTEVETQAFQIELKNFLDDLHKKDPNYLNLKDQSQKTKYDQDSTAAFTEQYKLMMKDWDQIKETNNDLK
jgi:hypothetical protein